MKITLDVTHKFSMTVDDTGLSSLISHIDVPLYGEVCENLNYRLYNFILNLDDEIIDILNQQENPKFHNLNEETIFMVKQAHIHFGKIKGMDVAMQGTNRLPFSSCYQTWESHLDEGDDVYEAGGLSTNLPYGVITLIIVSNNRVTVTFELDECECFSDYLIFSNRAKQLNAIIDIPLPQKGRLFFKNY